MCAAFLKPSPSGDDTDFSYFLVGLNVASVVGVRPGEGHLKDCFSGAVNVPHAVQRTFPWRAVDAVICSPAGTCVTRLTHR